ncbi:hypothetical protein HRI_003888700 [Hibiscus trionum]|uniref:RING-type E3 ubiquitin transferase n=1 Tax=Hibiscus trionum TaxID=183268 RepID=A0A9W7IVS5_HIBTR|nr:hypothetical protein HRI_003887300 [Hibiscus trionum]GMJ02193.1 hypothetical protein HRI_003888500 [Hibiscus trionum]GMJ02194.1 hypothetical protein HRI_003888600 [Hibiscus trionum]GMJ02195.1 hypothetical protein HRI_003888700 [Hibiscus trionum]
MATHFIYNGFSHRVSLSQIITEIHHVPLPLVQIHLTISVANNFRLFDRPEPSFTASDQETLVFDLNLLRHRNQLHRLLVPTFTNLGVNTATVHYDRMVNKIIQRGLEIAEWMVNSGFNFRVLYLASAIEAWAAVDENTLEFLMERRALMVSAEEFETDNYGMVPATESSVKEMLTTVKVEDGEGDCTVCLEGLEVGSNAARMPCSHMFHNQCIEEWLKQSHYCPVCRFEMPC